MKGRAKLDTLKMTEESSVANVIGVNVEELMSDHFTVRPLHAALTATTGVLMALIFYIVVRHKTRGTHPVGLLWRLISMMDIALCVSALAALFYQHVANEKDYIRCVHVPLSTILSLSFTAAYIMLAVAGLRTVIIVYELSKRFSAEARVKASKGMIILCTFVTVTSPIMLSMNCAMDIWSSVFAQLEVCMTGKENTDMTIPFAWVSCIIASMIFHTRHASDQSDHTLYLEFGTQFMPLITAFYWLNGCTIYAGLYNMSSIVLVACVMLNTFFSLVTLKVFTLASTRFPVLDEYTNVITVI